VGASTRARKRSGSRRRGMRDKAAPPVLRRLSGRGGGVQPSVGSGPRSVQR
jgi:hypothetical protein